MRKFICVRDPYTRCGAGEPLEMSIVEAEDLDDLARKLDHEDSTFEEWEQMNGDGADYYLIHELLPDGTLSTDPILE